MDLGSRFCPLPDLSRLFYSGLDTDYYLFIAVLVMHLCNSLDGFYKFNNSIARMAETTNSATLAVVTLHTFT